MLWLLAALGISLLFAWRTMEPVFRPGAVLQSDARQHVFWTLRFRDPELFPGDLIADYFQAVAPPGYSGLYWLLSRVVDPLQASKLLPIPLGLAAAGFTFLLVRRLQPSPLAAFLATALASWYAWQYDDLASATPRAFCLPLLAALLWALAGGRLALGVLLVGLAAAFYPVGAVLGVALFGSRLIVLEGRRPGLARARRAWLAFGAAALLALLVVLPELLGDARFGPTVSADAARSMAEFGERGRNEFFVPDPYQYWLLSPRSGFDLTVTDLVVRRVPILYMLLGLAALLPVGLLVSRPGRSAPENRPGSEGGPVAECHPEQRIAPRATDTDERGSFSGERSEGSGDGSQLGVMLRSAQDDSSGPQNGSNAAGALLLHLLLASVAFFALAHLLLFKLYLPSRYVKWSVPLVLAVAAGLGLALVVEALAARIAPRRQALVAGLLGLGLVVGLVGYPAAHRGHFTRDRHPRITAYLREQPKATLVAGVSVETNSIPSFAGRSVLVGREFALAFHAGYYQQVRQRMVDQVDAFYAESPREVTDFAARYGVDVFLVNRAAYQRSTFADAWTEYANDEWAPFIATIAARLDRAERPALLEAARRCAELEDGGVYVVPLSCVVDD